VDFEATGQQLIIYSAFIKYQRKKWEYDEVVHQLYVQGVSGGIVNILVGGSMDYSE
jgi:hypothetical protein